MRSQDSREIDGVPIIAITIIIMVMNMMTAPSAIRQTVVSALARAKKLGDKQIGRNGVMMHNFQREVKTCQSGFHAS